MNNANHTRPVAATKLRPQPNLILVSRWLHLPLYFGLILAQWVYVFYFWSEPSDLIGAALGHQTALPHILNSITTEDATTPTKLNETSTMLVVLGLIDVIMISNLLIAAIVGTSSIPRLKKFTNAKAYVERKVAGPKRDPHRLSLITIAVACCNRIMISPKNQSSNHFH